VTTAESEIEGEKQVSRYAVEQSTRSTEAFLGLRSEVAALRAEIAMVAARVDHLAGEAAVTRATLIRHGRALDVLQQDVGGLRNDTIAIRRDMATRQELAAVRDELRSEVAAMRGDAVAHHAELLAAIRGLAGGAPPA
jgi:chromosome segregation ATPase